MFLHHIPYLRQEGALHSEFLELAVKGNVPAMANFLKTHNYDVNTVHHDLLTKGIDLRPQQKSALFVAAMNGK